MHHAERIPRRDRQAPGAEVTRRVPPIRIGDDAARGDRLRWRLRATLLSVFVLLALAALTMLLATRLDGAAWRVLAYALALLLAYGAGRLTSEAERASALIDADHATERLRAAFREMVRDTHHMTAIRRERDAVRSAAKRVGVTLPDESTPEASTPEAS